MIITDNILLQKQIKCDYICTFCEKLFYKKVKISAEQDRQFCDIIQKKIEK